MANYQYDEGGSMATYFILTFLSLILIPLTVVTFYPSSKKKGDYEGCECGPCLEQREKVVRKETWSISNPNLGLKNILLIVGWATFAFLSYKIATTKIEGAKMYDPFEILGLKTTASDKEIKSTYKQLSRKFHPDKVKLAINQTVDEVESFFVNLTKAYKSLTDETIRKNWELFGHPDGRQEVSMGIAIPKWVVEGQNKFYVLLVYCAAFGGVLPVVISRWWFGNKTRTKDGVLTTTAEHFFKKIQEDSSLEDITSCLAGAYSKEHGQSAPLAELEGKVQKRLNSSQPLGTRQMTLLYAHLLRIPVEDAKLKKEQEEVILHSPVLLFSLMNIAMSRNWLAPVHNAIRLQAHIAQAVAPKSDEKSSFAIQLPNMTVTDAVDAVSEVDEPEFQDVLNYLNSKNDPRVDDVKKAGNKWGRLELVDVSFKVVGERIVTPEALINLVVKARLSPPTGDAEVTDSQVKANSKTNDSKDHAFLVSRRDVEELPDGLKVLGRAHAPYWPANRKPSWWVMISDWKTNRLVIPPFKLTDVPLSDPSNPRNFRSYKVAFRGPPQPALYPWKFHIVSDTFIGDEITRNLTLKVEDVSKLTEDEQGVEDDISEPEEDSLAGQMAMMRGDKVKRSPVHDDDDDDESGTDDDESSGKSSSDSDSD